ncbi:DUF1345 domain-containing protein [Hymenobacter cellulosilyticus]|uniref:DUF1345 domain-containing protein n=1 Tax=Hymenobacter cellulosilyticus TaxID=2932248 RepID=A0A8T9QB66_9BACT|nr:DUF1345 domain-containing protein [Hymenobacter cellulosilyticus]UOQ72769.1 DUF1345 domain-containing protein [Hymenobacter cellulosilyticus]
MPSAAFRLIHRIGQLSALTRLLVALVLGAGAWALLSTDFLPAARAVAAWDAFGLSTLLLIWAAIATADVKHIRETAQQEDASRTLSFAFVLVAALSSLLAVVLLLSSVHETSSPAGHLHVGLAIAAVTLAWLLVHTVFTLRYAHLYYDATPTGDAGGLEFPGQHPPDYLDFAYFSFVVGMTAQTADVSISGRYMRRLALLHGLVSFGFNTAVVALSISGLASVL